MSTVFLIGNGFDLSCGMKTRYTDMYKDYCKIQENDTAIIKQFKQDISNNEYETWADFELGMAKYAKNFSTENDFLSCLWDFKKYLISYLKNQEITFGNRLKDRSLYFELIDEMKRSVNFFYSGISNNLDFEISRLNDGKYQYICFNYTDTFNKLGKNIDYTFFQDNYVAIHGVLDKDVVLGVDNAQQVNTTFSQSTNFSRSFIKPYFNKEFDSMRVFNAKRYIENANLICTYGLSLGDTDLTWRELILQTLQKNPDSHLFYYSYDMITKTNLLKEQQLYFEEQEKKELAHKWQLKDDSEILRKIHIPCGKQLFNIKEVIKNHKPENISVD